MATVKDIIKRLEGKLTRWTGNAGPEEYLRDNAFRYVKDVYDIITELTRTPITSATIAGVEDQHDYDLPTDIFGNFVGVISLEYDGKPMIKTYLRAMQEMYYDQWREPPDVSGVERYLQYDNISKFYVVNAPGAEEADFTMIYVQSATEPTAESTTVPDFAEPYLNLIPDAILGMMLNTDKMGRGAAILATFKQEITRMTRKQNRFHDRLAGREAYTMNFDNYRLNYGRRGRRR